MQPADQPWRELRAAVIATVCLCCSTIAHAAAGGAVPAAPMLLGLWLAVGAVAFALSGRRWTFGRLLVLQGSGQLVLHPLFDAMAPAPSGTVSARMTVAHLIATVVLAAVLAHGDRVLWRLGDAVVALTRPLLGTARFEVVPIAVPTWSAVTFFADLPALPGIVFAPTAERAPPVSRVH